jgi:hypothetical protein
MTKDARMADPWREAHGGFRGSNLLTGGGLLLAAGALLALVGMWLGGTQPDPRAGAVEAGWLAYILGLGLVGLGFGWTCVPGILPRLGLTAAVLHVTQAVYLLFVLYGRNQPPVSPVVLTAGRLLSLVVLAAVAARPLGQRTAVILRLAAGLSLTKIVLREFAPETDRGATVDAILLLAQAAAILVTARRLRHIEDDWAREHHPGGKSDFSAFNNPEHDWNKSDRS